MNEVPAPPGAQPTSDGEWRDGWRIVLACALASGTGVVLLFFSFSLFLLPITTELRMTRGEFSAIQSLVVLGALGALIIGRLTDRFGFRPVFLGCTAICVAVQITLATYVESKFGVAVCVALLGFFGVGTSALTTTRPVSAHFSKHRGKALGLVVAGLAMATIIAPTPLQMLVGTHGWRSAVLALAALSVVVGVPAVLLLLPNAAARGHIGSVRRKRQDAIYLKDRTFWLLASAGIFVGAAVSGFVGQLSPLLQEEGVDPGTAALGLSMYALGQLIGRVGGGTLLDLFPPRRVAVLATLLPGTGFALLYLVDGSPTAALLAAVMIGLLAGIELDVGAFFVARLFPLSQYSTIYGALNAVGWIGNAAGLIGIGWLHDRFGSYASAQLIALGFLVIAALLFSRMRESPEEPITAG